MSLIKGLWRFVQPVRSYGFKYPIKIWGAYLQFLRSWNAYKRKGGILSFRYVHPALYFKGEDVQTGGGHYFYQDIWALKKLAQLKPAMHYDIGSRFDGFAGQATVICPVTAIDIRPPAFRLPGFHFLEGDILRLPFETNSISVLSCLHTIEHIGLGRYGDAIYPGGFNDALAELQRVVKPGGHLILSMPVGKRRVEFNAQRILDPSDCIVQLNEMVLLEFSVVNDDDEFIENASPGAYTDARYCCGLYFFKKVQVQA
jgi:SAM-dependent methyltransferase